MVTESPEMGQTFYLKSPKKWDAKRVFFNFPEYTQISLCPSKYTDHEALRHDEGPCLHCMLEGCITSSIRRP